MFENTTGGETGPVEGQVEGTAEDTGAAEEYWELEDGKDESGANKKKRVSVAEARKLAQKGYGADKTFEEAKVAREEARVIKAQMAQLAQMFRDDPWKVMEAFKLNPNELIKARFQKELADSMLDPRDKKLKEYESELQYHRRMKAQAEEVKREEQITSKAQEYQELLFGKIDEALKQAGVPNNPTTISEIGRYLQNLHGKNDKQGNPINIFKVPVSDIVKHVHSRFNSGYTDVLSGIQDDEALLSSVDPKVMKRLLAAHTKKLEASGTLNRRNAPAGNIDQFNKNKEEPRKTQRELEQEHAEMIRKLDESWKKKNPPKY
jgi:hypothetical protein